LGEIDRSETAASIEGELELDRPMSRMICIYHALSHPVRLMICKHLLARPHAVNEICDLLKLKQYVVSQQLAVLRNSDIVKTDRVSRNVIYSLRSDAVKRILRVSLRNTEIEEHSSVLQATRRASGFARISQ
jgi:DNA-binding transcriptional ArsR family regulator